MKLIVKNELYDINQLPNSNGLLFFPISLSRITNTQSAKQYLDWLLHFYNKITSGSEGVGVSILYGDYLYMHTSETSPAQMRSKFLDVMSQHRREMVSLMKKTHMVPSAVEFLTWGGLLFDNYTIFLDYKRQLNQFISEDSNWEACLVADADGRELTNKQRDFFLEESLLLYLINKEVIKLPNSFVKSQQ